MAAYVLVGVWEANQNCERSTAIASSCYHVRDPLDLAVFAAGVAGGLVCLRADTPDIVANATTKRRIPIRLMGSSFTRCTPWVLRRGYSNPNSVCYALIDVEDRHMVIPKAKHLRREPSAGPSLGILKLRGKCSARGGSRCISNMTITRKELRTHHSFLA